VTKTLIGTPDPDQPPQPPLRDEHAERTILAALLHYPSLTAHLTAVLDSSDFTTAAHQQLFAAAVAARDRSGTTAAAAVITELARHRPARPDTATTTQPEQLVRDVAGAVPVEAVTVHYVAIVRDLAALRRHQRSTHPEGLPPMPIRGFLIDEDDN
jgi:replicative DNA helicase